MQRGLAGRLAARGLGAGHRGARRGLGPLARRLLGIEPRVSGGKEELAQLPSGGCIVGWGGVGVAVLCWGNGDVGGLKHRWRQSGS